MTARRVPYRLRAYVRGSLWIAPLLAGVLGLLLAALVRSIDEHVHVPAGWQYAEGTASAVLSAIVGAMIALTGIVVAIGVLVIQSATTTLSPRFMRLWYRDRLQKAVLAGLVGTFAFAFSMLRHLSTKSVPDIGVTVAGVAVAFDLLLFLLYLNRFVHRLRPVGIAALMAGAGRRVFDGSTRSLQGVAVGPVTPETTRTIAGGPALVVTTHRSGVIQEIDAHTLSRVARRRECLFVLPFAIGDFVPSGAAVLEVHGETSGLRPRRLRELVGLGRERSIAQDPAFALRVLVDIAIRALSPAVNDPTTAVQVLDHIEDLLFLIGASDRLGLGELRDADGRACVVLPARGWDEYLTLAVTEILEYGRTSTQVMRRMRALLDELLVSVRPEHREEVRALLARLDAAVAARPGDEATRRLAAVADRQGLGGPQSSSRPS